MSETIITNQYFPEPLDALGSRSKSQLRWGAIVGGLFVALGLWLLLYMIGSATGLVTADPNDPSSLKPALIGTGIGWVVAPVLALLGGGWVTAQNAVAVSRLDAGLHGATLWGLTVVIATLLIGMAARGIVRGMAHAGEDIASGAGHMIGSTKADNATKVGDLLGIDSDVLLAPINQRLESEGKPSVTVSELEAALQDVARSSLRQGRLDQQLVVTALTRQTPLAPAEAQNIARRVEQRWNDIVHRSTAGIQSAALHAADATGKAFWWGSLALFLALCASVGGALLGASSTMKFVNKIPILSGKQKD